MCCSILEEAKDELGITDYSVSQASLQQIFVYFAEQDELRYLQQSIIRQQLYFFHGNINIA